MHLIPKDRAMTPAMIRAEIIPKQERWIRAHVPQEFQVMARTRPPLYWESKVRGWWEQLTA